jgi:transposase-like protein
MPLSANTERYKNHCFPSDIIRHGVWRYYRCTLSSRDVQELLCARGIGVTYEAIPSGVSHAGRTRPISCVAPAAPWGQMISR